MGGNVGEYGFYHCHALTVNRFAAVRISPSLHPVSVVALSLSFFEDEGYLAAMTLAGIRRVGVAQALGFEVTGAAFGEAAFKEDFGVTVAINELAA